MGWGQIGYGSENSQLAWFSYGIGPGPFEAPPGRRIGGLGMNVSPFSNISICALVGVNSLELRIVDSELCLRHAPSRGCCEGVGECGLVVCVCVHGGAWFG